MMPAKNSLSLSLTESVLFLRTPDLFTRHPTSQENAPPSMLRGLLILTLCKPTRISSIQVDLIGESVTTWTEPPSTRYQAQMDERHTLFSASRTFFTAPRGTTTRRRALSLEPRLSDYADEDEPIHRRRPSNSSSTHDPVPVDMLRGRERGRPRPSPDGSILPPDLPPQELQSRSVPTFSPSSPILSEDGGDLTASSVGSSRSPRRRDSSTAGETHRVTSVDNTSEAQGFPSRGHTSAWFNLANVSSSILEAVRSVSGPSREHGLSQRGAESRGDVHSQPPSNQFGHLSEAGGLDNEQSSEVSGDGWQEFKKGTYTFPISFTIPSNVPPTIRCNYGAVTWRLKARVHRPGAFTSKLCAEREVVLVVSPSEDNGENLDVVSMDHTWEDQMQYALTSGRVFPIGGTVPLTLTLLPMAKVKIFKILVRLEERVEYYYSFSPFACRTDPERRFKLVTLESRDEDTPLLPVPQTTSLMDSPLYTLLNADDSSSEFIANLMGPGPWTFPMALKVPCTDGKLHFSYKNRRTPIKITHTLRVVVRVQRAGEREIDPATGKPKLFDLTMRVPVHVLSSLSNAQHTALPRYTECAAAPSPAAPPYAPSENGGPVRRRPHDSVILQSQVAAGVFQPHDEQSPSEVDVLYERNMTFERLITGQQSEDGIVPPAYCAAS